MAQTLKKFLSSRGDILFDDRSTRSSFATFVDHSDHR